MTLDEAKKIAQDIAEKSQSVFHTDEAKSWIAHAIFDAATEAKNKEHDRIELVIGNMKFQDARRMIENCKRKAQFYAQTEKRKRMELDKIAAANREAAKSGLKEH